MKAVCDNENGFTLLELLISITILAIGLLGVAALQMVAIHGNMFGKEMTLANTVIAGKIEALRGIPYANVTSHTEYVVLDGKESFVLDTEPSDGFYMTVVTTVNVTNVQNGPATADTKNVLVNVSWRDRNQKTRQFQSETIIFNNDAT